MSEKKKILIVDDDKDYGEALKMILAKNGFEVHHALNEIGRASCRERV